MGLTAITEVILIQTECHACEWLQRGCDIAMLAVGAVYFGLVTAFIGTRVYATGRRFAACWLVIYPGSAMIRRM